MNFLNPVFLPTLFILTVAATPPGWAQSKSQTVESKTAASSSSNEQNIYLRRCATPDNVWVGAAKKETRSACSSSSLRN